MSPRKRTSPWRPSSARATEIFILEVSRPTKTALPCCMARPLCVRLGAGPSGATLVRRIARDEPPLLQKRTYGLLSGSRHSYRLNSFAIKGPDRQRKTRDQSPSLRVEQGQSSPVGLGDGASDRQPQAKPAWLVHTPRGIATGKGLQHGFLVSIWNAGPVVDDLDVRRIRRRRTQPDDHARAPLDPILGEVGNGAANFVRADGGEQVAGSLVAHGVADVGELVAEGLEEAGEVDERTALGRLPVPQIGERGMDHAGHLIEIAQHLRPRDFVLDELRPQA